MQSLDPIFVYYYMRETATIPDTDSWVVIRDAARYYNVCKRDDTCI